MARVLKATTRAEEYELRAKHVPSVARFLRRLKQDGTFGFPISVARFVFQKIRIALEVEPILVPSDHGFFFPDPVFVEMCAQNRLEAHGFPTEEITGTSKSRWDYLATPFTQERYRG